MATTTPPSCSLAREHALCPITALSFFSSSSPDGPDVDDGQLYLLAGEDTCLAVYDARTSALCARWPVFGAQPVHGISVGDGDGDVLVWGGSLVAVVPRGSVLEGLSRRGEGDLPIPVQAREVTAPDLVYSGAMSPWDGSKGVVVTAHNEVLPFTVRTGDGDGSAAVVALGRLLSPSRPILYSASVTWTSAARVLVAGGTVFGEIVVWRCDLEGAGCEVLRVLSGHEGSIFDVCISPEIAVSGRSSSSSSSARHDGETARGEEEEEERKVRLLASCSDDRTIRVWDITDGKRPAAAAVREEGLLRETTGFTNALEEMAAPSEEVRAAMELAERPVAVVMGHDSRIWGVRFAGCRGGGGRRPSPESDDADGGGQVGVSVYSFGEDATAQEWALDLALDADGEGIAVSGKMRHCRTVLGHSGKHIWANAVLDRGDGRTPVVATGGADGKIGVWGDIEDRGGGVGAESEMLTMTVPDVLASMAGGAGQLDGAAGMTPVKSAGNKRGSELLHSFDFVSEDRILAVTSAGRIFLGVFQDGGGVDWSSVQVSEEVHADLAGYNITASPRTGIAFFGTASGKVYMYTQTGEVLAVTQLDRKIADIFFLPDTASSSSVKILATCIGLPGAHLLGVDTDTGKTTNAVQIGTDDGLVVSSVTSLQGYIVVGTRKGRIHLFEAQSDGPYTSATSIKLEVKDAITSLVPLPGANPSCFLATCRDGAYRIYQIVTTGTSSPPALALRHESSPPFGPVIAGALFARAKPANGGGGGGDDDYELVLLGFRSVKFVVWNETRQEEVAAVDCAGAHRRFAHLVSARDPGRLRFAFTKTSTLNVYGQARAARRAAKSGGHGREVRSVGSSGEHVATGAEDTIVRIWRYQYQGPGSSSGGAGFRCVAVMNPHNTGIPALKWVGKEYLLSAGGFEKLFVWRVSRLDSDYKGLAVACESAYPDCTRDKDLRIMSVDAEDDGDGSGALIVSLVLSSSVVKTYRYARESGWRLLARGRYTGACPTGVRHLDVREGRALAVLVTFTDGHVTVWRAGVTDGGGYGEYSLQGVARMHQNSIKALDLVERSGGWLVVTGGDDNALGISHLVRDGEGRFSFVSKYRASRAHAAAISALKVVRHGDGKVLFVSCSNDQRVKTWSLKTEEEEEEEEGGERLKIKGVQLLSDEYSSVADPGDLEVLGPEGPVAVVGVGMETWDMRGVSGL